MAKAVAESLEAQRLAYEAKMAAEEAERQRLRKLREEEEARALAKK